MICLLEILEPLLMPGNSKVSSSCRLAERCQVDLSVEVLRKLEKNALKYPVEKARGRSEKYTEYEQSTTDSESSRDTKPSDSSREPT